MPKRAKALLLHVFDWGGFLAPFCTGVLAILFGVFVVLGIIIPLIIGGYQ